ncbi:MAG: PQQ-binding-like beta-propeller repeat protein, partial [Candidatus Eremiobacterota bacterium]
MQVGPAHPAWLGRPRSAAPTGPDRSPEGADIGRRYRALDAAPAPPRCVSTSHTSVFGAPGFDSQGTLLLWTSRDQATRYQLDSLKPDGRVVCQETPSWRHVTLGQEGRFAYASDVGDRVWLQKGDLVLTRFEVGARVTTPVVFTPDGNLAFGTADPDTVMVISPDGGVILRAEIPRQEPARAGEGLNYPYPVLARRGPGPRVFYPRKGIRDRTCPFAVVAAPDGAVLVQTQDDRVIRVSARGELEWCRQFDMPGQQGPALSLDGKRLYVSGVDGRFLALDPRSGQEVWSCDYGPDGPFGTAPPVEDEAGNVYTLTWKGAVFKMSPDGRELLRIKTGHEWFNINTARPMLALDRQQNVCCTPNCGHFLVYSPEGAELQHYKCSEVFRPVDYL